ncbi:MAG: hypothetical protein J6E46_12850 [Faecalicoccus sp.]|nr:hypothetical protein [Faecalicoccus sp.]
MKEFKTVDEQLKILKEKGVFFPKTDTPGKFLEQENYYKVINGYKNLFLLRD